MIVLRQTHRVKPGCMKNVVELAKRGKEIQKGMGVNSRLYIPLIAPLNTIAVELEFSDLTALDQFMATWFRMPEVAEGLNKLNDFIEASGSNEVWELIE